MARSSPWEDPKSEVVLDVKKKARKGKKLKKGDIEWTRTIHHRIFSWEGKKSMDGARVVDKPKRHFEQTDGTCLLSAAAKQLTYHLRLRHFRLLRRCRVKVFPPTTGDVYNYFHLTTLNEGLDKILALGMPTTRNSNSVTSSWYRPKGHTFLPSKVFDLYRFLKNSEDGGPFCGYITPKDTFPDEKFPSDFVYKGEGSNSRNEDNTTHAIVIIGLGREEKWVKRKGSRPVLESECFYWEFENSWGSDYGFGKLDVDQLEDAFAFIVPAKEGSRQRLVFPVGRPQLVRHLFQSRRGEQRKRR